MNQICTKCGADKLLSEFHKSSASPTGHKTRCKKCLCEVSKLRGRRLRSDPLHWSQEKLLQRERRKDPRKKAAEQRSQFKYRYSVHGRAVRLHLAARQRAQKSCIPFSITVSDVERALIEADDKFRSTLPFDYTGRKRAFTPSLDQLLPGQGYTPDNIRVIHLCWNTFKGDFFTDTEAIEFASAMTNIL